MKRTMVRELMTQDVTTLEKGQSMPTAEELLRLLRIRHLPVVDRQGKLVGLVTHRQLLQAHVNLLAQLGSDDEDDPEDKIPVRRVMQSEVLTISPDQDAATALELMLSKEVGSLPVLEDGRVVGIITSKDFLAFQLRKLRAESSDAAAGTLDDDSPTIPDAPPAAAPVGDSAVPPAGDAAPTPEATGPRGGRSVLAGIVLLVVGLGLGFLAARLLRTAPGPAPSPTAADDAAVNGAPAAPDAARQTVQSVPPPVTRDAGAVARPPGPAPRSRAPDVRSRPGTRPRPDVRSRLDVRSRPDARSRPARRRPRDLRAPAADRGQRVWIPEKIPEH